MVKTTTKKAIEIAIFVFICFEKEGCRNLFDNCNNLGQLLQPTATLAIITRIQQLLVTLKQTGTTEQFMSNI